MVEIPEAEWNQLKFRLAALEDFVEIHSGPDIGTTESPHPNQRVQSLYFGGQGVRVADDGIQFSFADIFNPAKKRGIYWVPNEFVDDPSQENEFVGLVGLTTGLTRTWKAEYTIDSANARHGNFSILRVSDTDTAAGIFLYDATGTPDLAGSLYIELDNVADTVQLLWDDGGGPVLVITADHASWVDLTDGGATTLHSHRGFAYATSAGDATLSPKDVRVYTGTGGHTFTMATSVVDDQCVAKNNGTGLLTVARFGAGTIDGLASVTLAPGDSLYFYGIGVDTWVII